MICLRWKLITYPRPIQHIEHLTTKYRTHGKADIGAMSLHKDDPYMKEKSIELGLSFWRPAV